jgi:hypothetical protein
MQDHLPIPDAEMVRIPGLYRRWELPDVLKDHHAFRIEDAGTHQDGTPLVAIYAAGDSDPRMAGKALRHALATSVPRARETVSEPRE